MIRVRKLVLAIAAASALSSGMAQALGLGEVTIRSSLNQPLVADIELLEARDLSTDEVRSKLASPDEFVKAGVERPHFLTDLKFTSVIKPNGKSIIRVTSSQPVREPYLNFLVEVLWPNGRALREYTMLLDPPLYSTQAAAAASVSRAPSTGIQQPAETRTAKAYASSPPAIKSSATPRSAAPAPLKESRQVLPVEPQAAGVYKTTSADTLWQIAERAPGKGSAHQKMLAIQDLNPDAFVDGNINRLKRGQVLRLPDEQQINSRTQSQAVAQVRQQNVAWRSGSTAVADSRQLDATKRSVAGAAPAEIEVDDNLKLVSASTGKATSGADTGKADTKAISNKLAVTEESLDSSRRENEELQSRMGDLQSQLDKLQRLIQLKDSQLAALQAELGDESTPEQASAAAADANGEATDGGAGGAGEPVDPGAAPIAQADAPEAAVAANSADGAGAISDESAEKDFNYSEEPKVGTDDAAPVVADVAPTPAAPAPTVADAPDESSALDDFLANPMLLGATAGGALLLLLLGLMVASRRNAAKDAAEQEALANYDFDSDTELPADSLGALDNVAQDDEPAEEPVTAKTADVLSESDIYIAYGRFNQAVEILETAINNEPQRADLRLKLMEVYAEMGDREGFVRQENELLDIGGSAAEIDQLKARYPAMIAVAAGGAMLLADDAALEDSNSFNLDDLAIGDVAPLSQTAEPLAGADEEDEFDFDLDDLQDLDEPAAPIQATATPVVDAAADDELAAFDDLQLDDALAEEPVALNDELDDFNFDFDAEEPAAAKTTAVEDEEDFLLNFDDELSESVADLTPAAQEPVTFDALDLPADFDLSLDEAMSAEQGDDVAIDALDFNLDDVSVELDELEVEVPVAEVPVADMPVADMPPVMAVDDELVDADLPEIPEVTAESVTADDFDGEDDFDFLSGTDETATKLDLARAYIDMGDAEGAKDILDEVIAEGNDGQQQEAKELIAKMV